MTNRTPRVIGLIALLVYGIALFRPAYVCPTTDMMGYEILAIGWIGLLALDPRWFANVGFAILLYKTFQNRPASMTAMLTGLLSLTAFLPSAACGGPGGAPDVSKGLAQGGFLWIAAIWIACVANQLVPPDRSEAPTEPMELEDR